MIAPDLATLAAPIDTLGLLPGNPRQGDVDAVARSLARFGQRKPIVAKRDGTVIAGNHTLQAARSLGWSEIAVVWTDDDDATASAFALADNRTAELGGYDEGALLELIQQVHEVDPALLGDAGWLPEAVAALEASLTPEVLPPGLAGDPDATPDVPDQPVSVTGDLWHLGPHRLLCGDSTNPDDVDRVLADVGAPTIVYTDPPYGISIVRSNGKIGSGGKFRGKIGSGKIVPTTEYLPVAGDDTTDAAADAFRLLFTTYPDARHVWWGGNHYAASAGLTDSSCWLVWDKQNDGNDFADCEIAWTNHPGAVRMLRHMWNGMLRASERGKRVHPTQKPVALAEWAFSVVDPDETRRTVLDVFGGSGSTLIAAQVTGRTAAVIEMEPSYVDVICRRYQEATGDKPILAATSEAHDFTGGSDAESPEAD